MKKRIISVFIAMSMICMLFTGMPISVLATTVGDLSNDGYELDTDTGKLTIANNTGMTKWISVRNTNGSAVKNVQINDGVTSIRSSAFSGCTSLTSVNIPDSVTSIGSSAFSGCTSLTSVNIPGSVTSMGIDAFSGCTSLTSITIPGSVTSMGIDAFSGCTSLTSVNILDGVTSIGTQAFKDCTSLTSVHIPNSVTSIGMNAFAGCTSLTTITIPDGVTSIESGAFSSCTSLTTITIPDGVTSVASHTFNSCTSLTTITIPDGVTSIGTNAFTRCTSLESITIPGSVTSIGMGAFISCTSLESITIPDSVTSINGFAFRNCTGLTSITIPDGVTSIGESAFLECSSLDIIIYPDGAAVGSEAIPDTTTQVKYTVNNGTLNVTEITLGSDKTSFTVTDDMNISLVAEDQRSHVSKTGHIHIYSDGVCQICDAVGPITGDGYTFDPDTGKLTIASDDAATNWSNNARIDKRDVKSVEITDQVTSIGDNAFMGCTGLTTITIPGSVTSIGDSAFKGCTGFTTITIPGSVISIGDNAFNGCSNLAYALYPNDASCGEDAFGTTTQLKYDAVAGGDKYKVTEIVPGSGKTSFTITDDMNISFVAEDQRSHVSETGHIHTGGIATCIQKAKCDICDAEYGGLAAHTLTAHAVVAATCTTDGNEAYWTCSACNKMFSDENGTTEIDKIPVVPRDAALHIPSDWIVETPATADTEGVQIKVCTVCGTELARSTIDKLQNSGTDKTSVPSTPPTGDKTPVSFAYYSLIVIFAAIAGIAIIDVKKRFSKMNKK